MTTTTVRPDGTSSVSNYTVVGAANAHTALSDNSDSTHVDGSAGVGGSFGLTFGTFSLPGGNVVKSVTCRARYTGTPTTCTVSAGSSGNSPTFGFATAGGITTGTSTPTPQFNGVALSQADIDALTFFQQHSSGGAGLSNWYEVFIDVVHAVPPTAATVSAPSGSITTTRKPLVSWTFNGGSDGAGQTKFRVRIFSAAQYGAGGFDPATSTSTYDSGTVSSSSTSHTPTVDLDNGVTYKAYVITYQTTSGIDQVSTGGTSGYGVSSTFTISITVPVPTNVTPAASTTQTTSRPAIGADVGAMSGGSLVRREWQFATDAGFIANVLNILEATGAATKTGSITFPVLPSRLFQGTWFVRARAKDEDDVYGSYSSGQSFTVSHPATTSSRAPGAGSTRQYGSSLIASWVFSDIDPEDFQLKYQAQLWKASAPGSPIDSTLLTSGNLFHTFTIPDTTWRDVDLRWKVQVQDQDSATAGYSVEQSFFLSDPPTITVTSPTLNQVITTAAPLITWSFSATLSRTATQFKVDITNLTTGVLAISSGWIAGTATSWQVPTPTISVGPSYSVTVSVIDSVGLTGTGSQPFTASYAAPATPTFTVNTAGYPNGGVNVLDWSGASLDANFYRWRVYRRLTGSGSWTLLYETASATTRTYSDYTAPSNTSIQYAVVQVILTFGVPVESVYAAQTILVVLNNYVLVCPESPSLNVILYHVPGDSFQDEEEQAEIALIGRGRRVEYGSRFGRRGTLTATLRDVTAATARTQRLALDALRNAHLTTYLLNPFGDVWKVALGVPSYDRVPGRGLLEDVNISLPYTEITA